MNEPLHRAGSSRISPTRAEANEPVEGKSDEVLISLFQSGDQGVFRVLVERYQERVRNLLYSIFHETETIDDLAQEVFIKAYEGLGRFRFESSFYTWLYRIAVNRSRDELRKRKVRRFFSFQSMDESTENEVMERTTVQPASMDEQELVAKGLSALPEKYRMPVILKDLDGLSYEEIADVLECEIGTVKSRLSRGRTMLRNILRPLLKEAGE
ncbi:MAG: sigma-70 family RNA polymerase sigma factor [Ignavibacteriales bacterium]|nr:sigma-70 family RNA polymerase sigma factor [Ignavibacteriales bacterium]